MRYKIIGDSCLDLTKEMRKDPCYSMIPLTLMVGERHFVDDETFDQKEFIKVVKEYPECPKSACPSPEMFKEAYCCEEENVFVITLSAALSGSYNSAVLAKSLYEEEYGKKNILVLDSKSASSGQLNIAMYIRELCDQGLEFDEICEKAAACRDRMNTYFVLESLDTLKKNGRLTGLQAFFATKLNIKPVMGADNGTIIKLDQARGIQKALQRMAEIAVLRTHIVNYAKTRDTYAAYRKAGYSPKFRSEHEADILLHQAAKQAFDQLNVKKLPKMKALQAEYAALLAEKKEAYAELRKARDEARELLTVKANVDRVLQDTGRGIAQEKEHSQR